MTRFLRLPCAFAVVSLLLACESMPTQAYNKAENIRVVALAPLGIPPEPDVRILTPIGGNYVPLIGDLIDGTRAANASRELRAVFAETGYDYQLDVRESLALALAGAPFSVSAVAGERPEEEQFTFLGKCPDAPGADGCLDVVFTYVGYMASGPTTDYVPTVHLMARLIRYSDGATLFQDSIEYNPYFETTAIVVQPSPEYVFKGRKEMQADPHRVTEGLKKAVRAATGELAKQFM
jgi:hypothetical protein